jgi:4'-phosphopantetheinyl transferase EntD
MIREILPDVVAAEEAFDDSQPVPLFPEEEAVIVNAVDKRRREFATARVCARRALARLGFAPVAILPGARGAPGWPPGVTGSITHCAGYRGCAVARARDIRALGIDAEPHGRLPDGVLAAVSSSAERSRLGHLTAAVPTVHWDRLLFSAKEAIYKAWFPLTQQWLGFEDADVSIDPVDGTFTVRLLLDGPPGPCSAFEKVCGRWLVGSGLIVTTLAIPA